MTPRQAKDPLDALRVTVRVARGDAVLEAECSASASVETVAALLDLLDAAALARPSLLPTADHVPSTPVSVYDEEEGYRRAAPRPMGFTPPPSAPASPGSSPGRRRRARGR